MPIGKGSQHASVCNVQEEEDVLDNLNENLDLDMDMLVPAYAPVCMPCEPTLF